MKPETLTVIFTAIAVLASAIPVSAGQDAGMSAAPMPTPMPPPPPESGGLVDEIGAELTFGYDSIYMFRGVDFGDNLMWSDVNVTLPLVEGLELNAGAWYASLAEDDYAELDLYGGLEYAVTEDFSVGVGYTWYYFARTGDEVDEVGASLTYSLAGIDFGVNYYYDFETDGSYYEVGASYEIPFTDSIALAPAVTVGFGDDYYGVSGGNHVGLVLGLPIQLTRSASLTPYIGGNIPNDALDDLGEDDQVYGGAALTVSF